MESCTNPPVHVDVLKRCGCIIIVCCQASHLSRCGGLKSFRDILAILLFAHPFPPFILPLLNRGSTFDGRLRRCHAVIASYEIRHLNSSRTYRDGVSVTSLDVRARQSSHPLHEYDHRTKMDFPKATCVRESSWLQLQKLDHPTSGFYAADHKPRLA